MRGRTAAFAAAVGLSTVLADPALGHSVAGADKMTERQLRAAEVELFGAEHGAEHAATRRLARREARKWRRMTPAQRRAARRPAARASAGDPSQVGRWLPAFDMPVVAVHAAVLPTGKVMVFSQTVHDYRNRAASAYLWDPAKAPGQPGEFEAVPPEDNIWCGGQSLLSDGQLLVTGGNLKYATNTTGYAGLNTVFTFDPWTKRWTRQPDMRTGRWYPTQTLLPDGRTLITSGYDEFGGYQWNKDMDVFVPPAQRGGRGSVETIARYGELQGAPQLPHWYPHWFVMPSGGVLNAGFTKGQSWLLDPSRGAVKAFDRPDWRETRKYGSAVLMPGSPSGSTRVMMLGGYDHSKRIYRDPLQPEVFDHDAVASTEVFDEASPTTPSRPGPEMLLPRQSHNTVLLPDASIVNIGGGPGELNSRRAPENGHEGLAVAGPEHRAIEILDPGADSWRLGPSQQYKRAYHSTALLLPDGRVLSAGDDRDPSRPDYRRTDRAEIYEPAYLHKPGPRPEITLAPEGVAFGESFSISTSTPVSKAVLMAPGAVTHANNMSQRMLPLEIHARPGGADLRAPANANVAPPGYYMLFALSPNGKPSVAKWVYVGASRPAISAPVNTTATPVTPAKPAPKTPATDKTAPTAKLRMATRASTLRRRGRLTLALRLSEPGTVSLSAEVKGQRGRVLRVPRRGSVRIRYPRARTRGVTLSLTPAQRRRLGGGAIRGTVRLSAADAAGNRKTKVVRFKLVK